MDSLPLPTVALIAVVVLLSLAALWLSRLTPERLAQLEHTGGILGLLLGLAVTVVLVLRSRRREPPVITKARTDEAKATDAAAKTRDKAVRAADARLAEAKTTDSVKRANDIIRKRTGGALCLAALVLSSPAWAAEPEPCVTVDDKVVCTRVGFDSLLDSYAEQEHRADVNAALLTEANAKIAAKDAHIATLEQTVRSPPFPWKETAIGVGIGLAAAALFFGIAAVAK